MQSALLIIHVLLSLSLIGLVLIQQGKGADAGAAFGGGASSAVFGSSGAGSFLTKLTTGLAIAFFITSLGLAYISASSVSDSSIVDQVDQEQSVNIETPTQDLQSTADLPGANAIENDLPSITPESSETSADLPAN